MKHDELWMARDGNFHQVIAANAFSRTMSYVGGIIGILAGPVMMIALAVAGAFEWPTLVGGIAILLTLGSYSVAAMVSTRRMQRRVERLRRDGRPAIAEVVGSREVSLGEESGVEATLRISGDGVPTFQVPHRGSSGAIDRLGARFPVIVDPRDGAYLIPR